MPIILKIYLSSLGNTNNQSQILKTTLYQYPVTAMKKITTISILFTFLVCLSSYGQNSFPASGSVGIGTLNPNPNFALDVNGTVNASEIFVTQLNVTDLLVNGSQVQSSPWSLNGSSAFYNSGNVGIGTNSPAFDLDVNGSLNATSILLNGTEIVSSPWEITGSDLSYTSGNVEVGTLNASTLRLNGSNVVSSPWTVSGSDLSYTAGNIGVGTTTPGYALDVAGTLNATNILLNGSPLETGSSPWSLNGSNAFYNSGNVGIGTNSPSFDLDVNGSLNATNILLNGTEIVSSPWEITGNNLSYTSGNVEVGTLNASTLRLNGSDVVSSQWATSGNNLSYTAGNIGVGTTTPGYALDVAGTLNATNILLNGAPLETGSSPWTVSGNDLSYTTGNVGIGTSNTQGYMLAVAGNVVAESVKVELEGNWPDFVFEKEYELLGLLEVESFIKKHGHLPNVPSAEEIKKDGINLGQMDAKLLQKIEELTLHAIQQQKEIERLKATNEKLNEQNKLIQALMDRLEKMENATMKQ